MSPWSLPTDSPSESISRDDRVVLPDELWEVFEAPQCYLQLLFAIQLGNLFEYPWTETESAVQQCVEHIGADGSYTAPTCPWSAGSAPIARPSTSTASTAISSPRASDRRSLEERPLA